MGRLDGRVALITGGASGIGAAAVRLFAAEGAAVAVLDRDGDGAARLVGTLGEGAALALAADVTDREAVVEATARAVATFGRLDVVYDNAGVPAGFGPVADLTLADWNLCLAVNVTGTLVCTQAALPHLRAAGGGSIVNQSSVAALVGIPGLTAYSAAKGAVVALTRTLAAELAPEGIRVNAICAGTVDTPMARPLLAVRGQGDLELGAKLTAERYPIGRIGTPDEIARAALFLASDESSFITGAVLTADGGMTIV
ncbi:MAG TPA: SDR family oxidoreductase [Acidimicrobiia bacterium]|nr:SDR family oxidoreductase [Acidimicrobiia bacterium]